MSARRARDVGIPAPPASDPTKWLGGLFARVTSPHELIHVRVVDPWLTDARQLRALPLRAHEREAIDQAVTHAGL